MLEVQQLKLQKQKADRVLGIDASTASVAFCLFEDGVPIKMGKLPIVGATIYDKIKDANFVADSINLCRETLKFFDIIIWLPLNPEISVNDSNNENRSTDETFRMEIDAIFDGIFTSYQQGSGLIFPLEDSPCMLKIEGDVSQKIEEIAQYLNADGDLIETEESVIEQLSELAEKFDLLNQVKNG